jgi:poly(hydroxyalkanoate) granule-associated protein
MAKTLKSNYSLMGLAGDLIEQIRLAGLGAAVTVQEKGGRLFNALIQEGATIEARITGKAAEPAHKSAKPQRQVSPEDVAKLEAIFETRVSRTLQRLQVPTRRDLKKVLTQMDALQKQVQTLVEKESSKPTDS